MSLCKYCLMVVIILFQHQLCDTLILFYIEWKSVKIEHAFSFNITVRLDFAWLQSRKKVNSKKQVPPTAVSLLTYALLILWFSQFFNKFFNKLRFVFLKLMEGEKIMWKTLVNFWEQVIICISLFAVLMSSYNWIAVLDHLYNYNYTIVLDSNKAFSTLCKLIDTTTF